MSKLLRIFALGGNEVSPTGLVDPETGKSIAPDIATQWKRTAETCDLLAEIIAKNLDHLYILTHGNGPQVGNILLRAEFARPILQPLPLDVCDADSQGAMGYMLDQLSNSLKMKGVERSTVGIITQVVVDKNDPAFQDPTKFIGPPYTKEEALGKQKEDGQAVKFYKLDEVGNEVWRRVVVSPHPIDIVEIQTIETNLYAGIIPIAVGGGGIPVVQVEPQIENGEEIYQCNYDIIYRREYKPNQKPVAIYSGVEAVIDKDLASSLLGIMLLQRAKNRGEDLAAELTIFTNVDGVKLNFQQPNQVDLRQLTLKEAQKLDQEGVFPAGSMGPKIKAAINFLEGGGRKVYITQGKHFYETLAGEAGTTIVP